MQYDLTLKYNEELVRKAACVNWRHGFGVSFLVAQLITLAALLFLIVNGDRSWLVGMIGTILLLTTAFAAIAYFVPRQSALGRLRHMKSPEVHLKMEPAGFSLSSELGTGSVPWSAVKKVWRRGDFWILSLSRTDQITLPLAFINADAQAFILQEIKRAGGRIES